MTRNHRSAIILLSGGLDSATCLAIARSQGFAPIRTLAFDYGQRHRLELSAAAEIARTLGALEHRVIHIDLRQFGSSALTGQEAVPKDRDVHSAQDIPITYVPARNTIFLSYALAWAEVLRCRDIFIGVNAVDYSGYPDCRPEFIAAFENLANLGTRMGVENQTDDNRLRIHTPLIHWSKAQIIRKGMELGVDYSLTHSCYDPMEDGLSCGHCDSCLLRKKGFLDAKVPDPTRYATTGNNRPPR